MRRWLSAPLVATLVLGWSGRAPAQEEVQTVLARAIQAHGGAEKLARLRAVRTRARGRIEIQGGLQFTQEAVVQLPAQIKESVQIEANGQTTTLITVCDGTHGWMRTAGRTTSMAEEIFNETREALHLMNIGRFTALKDQAYQLTLLAETRVDGRPAAGIKVASRGHRDVSLYFDKQTGLLLKNQRRAYDLRTRQEVIEERFFSAYEDVDGMKTPKKVVIERDGKKFMEAEVTEAKFLERVPDNEFTEP